MICVHYTIFVIQTILYWYSDQRNNRLYLLLEHYEIVIAWLMCALINRFALKGYTIGLSQIFGGGNCCHIATRHTYVVVQGLDLPKVRIALVFGIVLLPVDRSQ